MAPTSLYTIPFLFFATQQTKLGVHIKKDIPGARLWVAVFIKRPRPGKRVSFKRPAFVFVDSGSANYSVYVIHLISREVAYHESG